MSVGVAEIVILLVTVALVAVSESRSRRVWPWGIPAMLAIAALFTPADPVSQVLIGGCCSLVYTVGQLQTERRLAATRTEPVEE